MHNGNFIPLNKLSVGQQAHVRMLTANGNIRRRLLDLGMVPDTVVEALQRGPFGDPTAYYVRGAVIALRSDEARKVWVEL